MSSSSEQKIYICEQGMKNTCCRRSLLLGVLASRGEFDGESITVSLSMFEVAEFVKKLIFEFYDRAVYIEPTGKGRRKTVKFTSRSASQFLMKLRSGEMEFISKCSSCRSAYLRGIFLASGRFSDPKIQYSLEFSVPVGAIDSIKLFLFELDLSAKVSKKEKETLLYFRKLEDIEYFLGAADLKSAVFDLLNAQAEHQIRNGVNRLANCEMNNINKAVNASAKVTRLIEKLEEKGLLSQLPDELQLTAKYRVEYKEYSLSRLAGAITPPITKSGLIHRLKKIEIAAEELLGE